MRTCSATVDIGGSVGQPPSSRRWNSFGPAPSAQANTIPPCSRAVKLPGLCTDTVRVCRHHRTTLPNSRTRGDTSRPAWPAAPGTGSSRGDSAAAAPAASRRERERRPVPLRPRERPDRVVAVRDDHLGEGDAGAHAAVIVDRVHVAGEPRGDLPHHRRVLADEAPARQGGALGVGTTLRVEDVAAARRREARVAAGRAQGSAPVPRAAQRREALKAAAARVRRPAVGEAGGIEPALRVARGGGGHAGERRRAPRHTFFFRH